MALLTLNTLGITMLFCLISTLLKTIPVFGSAGLIFIFAANQLCRTTPLSEISLFNVFWLNTDMKELIISST